MNPKERDNTERAASAWVALINYQRVRGGGDDTITDVQDLISDLFHLLADEVNHEGQDELIERVISSARMNYTAEVEEEAEVKAPVTLEDLEVNAIADLLMNCQSGQISCRAAARLIVNAINEAKEKANEV